jgi:hypothetical protein
MIDYATQDTLYTLGFYLDVRDSRYGFTMA